MKGFYLRWGLIFLAGAAIGVLGIQRYEREVTTIHPEELLQSDPDETVRVRGLVKGGTLQISPTGEEVLFTLGENGAEVPVRYSGPPSDSLRELKTLVVVGQWDAREGAFRAEEIAIVPNYGFILAAYLIALVPLLFFLFHMERKVKLLYTRIKEAKVYEPEEAGIDQK